MICRITGARLVSTTPVHTSPGIKEAGSGKPPHVSTSLTPVSQSHDEASPTQPGSLQPSGLLNHEAMVGQFSLRCILDTGDGDTSESQGDVSPVSEDDPIGLGLVNLSVARCLFDKYVTLSTPVLRISIQ